MTLPNKQCIETPPKASWPRRLVLSEVASIKFAHLLKRGEFFEDGAERRTYLASRADAIIHHQAVVTCRHTKWMSRKK